LIEPSSPSSFLAAVLAFLGITDFTAAALPDEVASYYWSSQAPIRLMFFFALTAYTYLVKPKGFGEIEFVGENAADEAGALFGNGLSNNVVFTWAFMELMIWFWVSWGASRPLWVALIGLGLHYIEG
jgi:hypothetical protein